MLNKLYLSLPATLQNLALSFYGKKIYSQRFGGDIPEPYQKVTSCYEEYNESIKLLQRQRFDSLMAHAVKHVPFYNTYFSDKKMAATDVTPDNMSKLLPIIYKQDILKTPQLFISKDPGIINTSLELNTSGSSGTPMKIIASMESRRLNYHFYDLLLNDFGVTYRSKSTTFAGRILYKNIKKTPDRYDYYNNTQYLSSYFLSPDTVALYAAALNVWKPLFIDSYPSILAEFVELAINAGIKLMFRPKLIITSSETLLDQQKNKIESFFNCPIADHYGCTEMAISAVSKNGSYYAHPMYSIIELNLINSNRYEIYTTGLLNFSMPLIRYSIGDAIISENPNNPYEFKSVEGRLDEMIVTPEGRRIGRLDPAFKGIEGIRYAQVVQKEINLIEIKIVLNDGQGKSFDKELLIQNFKERTSPHINFVITCQDDIERDANGKFKSVVNRIGKS